MTDDEFDKKLKVIKNNDDMPIKALESVKQINKKDTEMKKEAQTIKVKTLVISVAVIIAIIASFVAGIFTANVYNSNLEKQIEIKAKQITALKENQ